MTAVSVPFLLADVVASVDSFRCIHGLGEEGGCVGIIKALLGRGVKPFGCVLACVCLCAPGCRDTGPNWAGAVGRGRL